MPVEPLQELVDLLNRRRQLVIYGPPGTGKTYVAKKLAERLAGAQDPSRVRLVQFHPSYAYEDFFEGFRPVENGRAGRTSRCRTGPLRARWPRRQQGREPDQAVRPDHRRDQPGQPGEGLRRALLPAGVPREPSGLQYSARRAVQPARQPVHHRHHEHRRPLDRPRRRRHAPPVPVLRDASATEPVKGVLAAFATRNES